MNSKSLFATLLAFVCMLAPVMSEIEAGQSVIVKIMGVPAEEKERINETYPISEKGLINLPFIGELPAAGLEAGELAKSIQEKYKDEGYFNNAVIQIIADHEGIAPQEQRVHLAGNVRAPGPSPFRKGLTVLQAVNAGGGATEFGAMNRVVLLRKGKQQVINLKKPEGKTVVTEADDVIDVPGKDWLGN